MKYNTTPVPSPISMPPLAPKRTYDSSFFPSSKILKTDVPSFTVADVPSLTVAACIFDAEKQLTQLEMRDEEKKTHIFYPSRSSMPPLQGAHAKTTAVTDSMQQHSFIIKELNNPADIENETKIFNLAYKDKFYAQINNGCIIMSNICHYRKASPLSMNPPSFWEKKSLSILKSIATELQRLHKLDIIHGDIYADNILINGDNEAYFIDFGLSKTVSDKAAVCTVKQKDYWPPERTNFDEHESNHPAPKPAQDIFSLGYLIQHFFLIPATANYTATLDWAVRATNPEPSARPQLCELITILKKACELSAPSSSRLFTNIDAVTAGDEPSLPRIHLSLT